MKISVSAEVGREISRLCSMFEISEDALLRRVLKLQTTKESGAAVVSDTSGDGFFLTREAERIPLGMRLRHVYEGVEYFARVAPTGIVVDLKGASQTFPSLSRAARAVTGSHQNGWDWWTVKDEDGNWDSIGKIVPRKKV